MLGTVAGSLHALDVAATADPVVGSSLLLALAPPLASLRSAAAQSDARQIVFLGDSLSISTTGIAEPVPTQLRQELERARGPGAALHSLAALGTGPFDYYFLTDEIIAAGADEVVIALSLNAFGESFRQLGRKQVSGLVHPSQLALAGTLPLHFIGLNYDDLLMNVLIVQSGGLGLWHTLAVEQARFGAARSDLARWLGERFGQRGPQAFQLGRYTYDRQRTRVSGLDRYTADSERRHYGPVLVHLEPDHPVLAMLGAATRRLHGAGVSTLVYVNPVNVDHLESVGIAPSEELAKSLALIRSTVEGAGGTFLDLHALLPDAAFRDAAGHFGGKEVNGPAAIAAAVARELATRERSQPKQFSPPPSQ